MVVDIKLSHSGLVNKNKLIRRLLVLAICSVQMLACVSEPVINDSKLKEPFFEVSNGSIIYNDKPIRLKENVLNLIQVLGDPTYSAGTSYSWFDKGVEAAIKNECVVKIVLVLKPMKESRFYAMLLTGKDVGVNQKAFGGKITLDSTEIDKHKKIEKIIGEQKKQNKKYVFSYSGMSKWSYENFESEIPYQVYMFYEVVNLKPVISRINISITENFDAVDCR